MTVRGRMIAVPIRDDLTVRMAHIPHDLTPQEAQKLSSAIMDCINVPWVEDKKPRSGGNG